MSIADKLEYTKMGIDDIQTAINEKGVQVGDAVPLGEYGDKIRNISGDSTGNFPNFLYDFTVPRSNTWSTKAAMPTARGVLTSAVYNGIIYCIGGLTGSVYTNANQAYNIATNTWSTKAAMPTIRGHMTSAVYNGIIYCIGGYNGSSFVDANQAYNIATNTWSTKAAMPNGGRSAPTSSIYNDVIYCIGGDNNSGYTNINQAYNITTNTWSTKAAMPTARSAPASAVYNGIIYCIGGFTGSVYTNANQAYDVATNTWSTKAAMPTIRGEVPAAEIYNRVVYVIGGHGTDANEAYDISTNIWSSRHRITTIRNEAATSAIYNNVVYIIGGGTTKNEAHTITETSLGQAKAGDIIFSSSPIRVGDTAVSANYETTIAVDGEIYPVTDYIGSLILIRKKSVGVWLQSLTPYNSGATLAFLRAGNVIFTDSNITLDGASVEKFKKVTVAKDSVLKFSSSNVVSLLWIN